MNKIIGVELKAQDYDAIEYESNPEVELQMFATDILVPNDRYMKYNITIHTTDGDVNLSSQLVCPKASPAKGTLRYLMSQAWNNIMSK